MPLRLFTIRDAKADAYMTPFFSRNASVAIRSVEEAVANPEHEFHRHSEDYSLWEIGGFNESTGELDPQLPYMISNLKDLDVLHEAPPILKEA